ncbi:hypothetical protein [Robertmurraya kyonggiensis]|uniref:Uncharacterized protein n=1 Tax=Robertmurraya kyonggiensis TaxID=1037680 RepID=A0A4U1DCE3_9BACI|nr:hypothetical protein [Robertmurraya kyonggiensis]TKC19156.1 hypothetical protein FA727_06320 [Robertmurraya kyonggiensis]
MKKMVLLILFVFLPHEVYANFQALIFEDVNTIEVKRSSGGNRTFSRYDGYEEVVIEKVLKWINNAEKSPETTSIKEQNPPATLEINLTSGTVATIEPAYNCTSDNGQRVCTLVDGEVIYTVDHVQTRLKSIELFDWLLVGWKYESKGAPKEELLEETLYQRYLTYVGDEFNDYILCPKIDKIVRIGGSTSRHIVYASALNYSGHHDGPYHTLRFSVTDTPENEVRINDISLDKNISEQESRKQCRRED